MAFRALWEGERKLGAWQGATSLVLVALAMLLAAGNALAAPGDPDLSFNAVGAGTYSPSGKGKFSVADVSVQPDGKILVVARGATASTSSTDGDFVILRLNPDGSPDPTFGDGGATLVDFGALFSGAATDDYPSAIAVQSTGKVLVGGSSYSGGNPYAVIARLNSNGVLDSSFAALAGDTSSGGRILLNLGNGGGGSGIGLGGPHQVSDMIVLPDNRIVVVGNNRTNSTIYRFFAVGLTAEGRRDPAFNNSDPISIGFDANNAYAEAVGRAPNGDIVVAGYTREQTTFRSHLAVARLSPTGSLVPGFGTGGTKLLDAVGNGTLTDVAIQGDGRIVLAAAMEDVGGVPNKSSQGLIRLNADGSVDGLGGQSFLPITAGPSAFFAPSLAIDPAGRLLFASTLIASDSSRAQTLQVTRVTPTGTLDSSFGKGTGTTSTYLGIASQSSSSPIGEPNLELQPDGGIVVGINVGNKIIVRRYQGDPPPVPAPPVPPPPADTTPPNVTGAKQSAAKWRVGKGQPGFSRTASARAAKARIGTTFSWTLSEAATMTFNFDAIKPGRKAGKKCVAPRKPNLKHKKCTRYLSKGRLTRSFAAGSHKLKFQGRIKSKKLSPGRYRLRIDAVDPAGNRARTRTLKFTVVR